MSDIQSILFDPQLIEDGIAKRCRYDEGQSIIVEGFDDRSVYFIEQGLVRVSGRVEMEDRRHIQPGLCDLVAGGTFGELSLFESAPRRASVVAIEPCELLVLDAAKWANHFDRCPERGYLVLKSLFSLLNGRLRQADRRLGFLFAWGLKAHGIDRHL